MLRGIGHYFGVDRYDMDVGSDGDKYVSDTLRTSKTMSGYVIHFFEKTSVCPDKKGYVKRVHYVSHTSEAQGSHEKDICKASDIASEIMLT